MLFRSLELRRKDQFVALVMRAREELKKVYGETSAIRPHVVEERATLRAGKDAMLAKLRADYEQLKAGWGGYAGYDRWFQRPLNNAHLNTIATYQRFVPAFQQLLANDGGDLQKFYTDAKAMAALAKERRHERMNELARTTPAGTASNTAPAR